MYSGFSQKKFENVYNKLIYKAFELFMEYAMVTLPIIEEMKSSRLKDFQPDIWSYKIVKLNKAMKYLEKSKHSDPRMSKSFNAFAEQILSQMKDTRSQSFNLRSDGSYGGHSTIRTIDSNFSNNELDMMLNCLENTSQGQRSSNSKPNQVPRKL